MEGNFILKLAQLSSSSHIIEITAVQGGDEALSYLFVASCLS